MPRKKQPWRYQAGRKGFNRVTVFERSVGAPLWIEWHRPTRVRRSLQAEMRAAMPISDRNIAKAYADAKANTLMHGTMTSMISAVNAADATRPHTLGELFDRYYTLNESGWSERHAKSQRDVIRFWKRELREDTLLPIKPSVVTEAAQRGSRAFAAGSGKPWSNATLRRHLVFIKAAITHAVEQEKWISSRDDLAAVKVPRADGENEHLTYTEEETARLLPSLEKHCDVRAWAVAEIYACSGHRTNAIRNLTIAQLEPYTRRDDLVVFAVHWDKAKQKNRKGNYSVLSVNATRALHRLIATPRVRACGSVFPSNDLSRTTPYRGTFALVDEHWLTDELRKAEEKAKVESVKNRGYHGLKRRYATDALQIDAHAAADQANTDEAVLRKTYRQARVHAQSDLVIELEKKRGGKRTA